ncbi:hypothetical protein AAMO2058_001491200 [Amorphochlora amoebiformis]
MVEALVVAAVGLGPRISGPRHVSGIRSRLRRISAFEFSPDLSPEGGGGGSVQVFTDPSNPERLYWKSEYQNPAHLMWGVSSQPFFDARKIDTCKRLQDNYETVNRELQRVLEARKEQNEIFARVGDRRGEATLVQDGEWRDYALIDDGGGTKTGSYSPEELCPQTVKLLNSIDPIRDCVHSKLGIAIFSCLAPGTHLIPHCGPTNLRLTCHLGLRIPEGVSIKVGSESREWEEGKCLIFDDSYLHEVKHTGSEERIVLLVNMWHPAIDSSRWREYAKQANIARQSREDLQMYFNQKSSRR